MKKCKECGKEVPEDGTMHSIAGVCRECWPAVYKRNAKIRVTFKGALDKESS